MFPYNLTTEQLLRYYSIQSSLETLSEHLGEYFQIRDDYKNLTEEVCCLFLDSSFGYTDGSVYSILYRKDSAKTLTKESFHSL